MQSLTVRIPAGVDTGVRLRLQGEGEAGYDGGPPGDLFVVVFVKDHPLFERDGADLHCEVPVSIAQAALGCEVEVPNLEGKENVDAEAGHAVRRPRAAARSRSAAARRRTARRHHRAHLRRGADQARRASSASCSRSSRASPATRSRRAGAASSTSCGTCSSERCVRSRGRRSRARSLLSCAQPVGRARGQDAALRERRADATSTQRASAAREGRPGEAPSRC